MNIIEESEKMLKKCGACSVSSVTSEGYPRICILIPLKTEGIKTFYFSTGSSSTKVKHYKHNTKSGVTFWEGGDSVTLTGEITIINDKKIKDALWQPWLQNHFSNGGKEDPEYCVLKFVAKEATVYVNNKFETIKIS